LFFHLKLDRSIDLRTLTLQPTEVANAAWLTLPDPGFAAKYLAERSPGSHFQPMPSPVEVLHSVPPSGPATTDAPGVRMELSAPEKVNLICPGMDGMISEATYFFICELAKQSSVQSFA
jgi:hypothetical protein